MFLQDLLIGGSSAIFSRTLTAPLELFKLQRQNSFMPHSTLRAVLKIEGTRYLWKGNGVNCLRAFPQFSVNYAVFEYTKKNVFSEVGSKPVQNFISGAVSGCTSLCCMYPLETLRSRLSLQTSHNHYLSITDAFQKMTFRDMYKGLRMSLLGFGPYNALNFTSYFYLTHQFEQMPIEKNMQKLLAGGLSGLGAVSITYPSDLIRRRLQLQGFDTSVPSYKGILDCISKVIRNEGVKGLYRGLLATYIKLFPTTAIQFWFLDVCNDKLKKKD